MRLVSRLAISAALGLAALSFGQSAQAAVSGPFSVTLAQTTTDFSVFLNLPKFDTSLGTLTEVDLSFEFFPRLKGMMTRKAGKLSGGERKMLAMGRVLLFAKA